MTLAPPHPSTPDLALQVFGRLWDSLVVSEDQVAISQENLRVVLVLLAALVGLSCLLLLLLCLLCCSCKKRRRRTMIDKERARGDKERARNEQERARSRDNLVETPTLEGLNKFFKK